MVPLGIFSIQYTGDIKQEIIMLDRRNYLQTSAVEVNAVLTGATASAQQGVNENKQADTTSVFSNIYKN